MQKSLKLETYISLTNFKHQLSEQLTARCSCTQPICKLRIQLATSSPFFLLFCIPVFLLAHHHLHIYHSSVNFQICNYFATMAYLLQCLLTPFAHSVYRFFYCVIDCTFVYSKCNSVFLSHYFDLSWPGHSCK